MIAWQPGPGTGGRGGGGGEGGYGAPLLGGEFILKAQA